MFQIKIPYSDDVKVSEAEYDEYLRLREATINTGDPVSYNGECYYVNNRKCSVKLAYIFSEQNDDTKPPNRIKRSIVGDKIITDDPNAIIHPWHEHLRK